ncbi:MAG: beta-carotene 15,15'-dioxygenase, Brp/Blh family [Eudoraea sp.]|nr:beta-carotene 15,15'-dioxygenase, Brp/Blh family [Eudoraea sp.]
MEKKQQNINTFSSFMIVSTFFFLWITVFFDVKVESILAYFLIFTFGIFHGSNDLKLIQKSTSFTKRSFFLRALGSYLAVVALTALFFSFIPSLALLFFVVASSYHFGEQHWATYRVKSALTTSFYTLYGLVIFFLLFYVNQEEVTPIIETITGVLMREEYYLYTLIVSFTGFIGIYLWWAYKKQLKINIIKELFFLIVFFIVFKSASLLWAFSIYFVIWHSIPSLRDQIQYLYGAVNKVNFLQYLKTSFLYWMISMVGLAVLYYFFQDREGLFLSIMIYFLAAITFPHVIVMTRLNRN